MDQVKNTLKDNPSQQNDVLKSTVKFVAGVVDKYGDTPLGKMLKDKVGNFTSKM